jgi:hypothetical protein
MTKLYYIKLGVSMILVTLEMARKHGEFNGIADTNADVKRIVHIFIYQIAEKIKNRKWSALIIVKQYL